MIVITIRRYHRYHRYHRDHRRWLAPRIFTNRDSSPTVDPSLGQEMKGWETNDRRADEIMTIGTNPVTT
jgi:hypothetical protein